MTRRVPPEIGSGYEEGGIVLVGRDPGRQEEKEGRPFVGRAGTLLDRCLAAAGIRRRDAAVTNLVPIRPRGNDFSRHRPEDVERGRRDLGVLLSDLRPNIVVGLGNEACYGLLPDQWPGDGIFGASGILDRRGYLWWSDEYDVKVLSAVHPASMLHGSGGRTYGFNAKAQEMLLTWDLERAREHAGSAELNRPERSTTVVWTSAELREAREAVLNSSLVGCDIEIRDRDTLACIGFAPTEHEAYVFPQERKEAAFDLLEDDRVSTCWQNGQFDLYFLKSREGVRVANYAEDSIVAFHCLMPELAGAEKTAAGKRKGKRTQKGLAFLCSLFANVHYWKCMSPDTRVLMADLSWKRLGDIEVGDEILSPNHDECEAGQGRAKWRKGEVTSVRRDTAPTYRFEMEDGYLEMTDEHVVLAGTGGSKQWVKAGGLQEYKGGVGGQGGPQSIRWARLTPWEKDETREAGWLAGFLDGEGTVDKNSKRIIYSQLPGKVNELAKEKLEEVGFSYSENQYPFSYKNKDGLIKCQVYLVDGIKATMEFLGKVRPERLVDNFVESFVDTSYVFNKSSRIQSIEPLGENPVVDISTTTGAFIANGFIVHNSYDFQSEHERYELNGLDCMLTLEVLRKIKALFPDYGIDGRIYDHEIGLVWPTVAMLERGIRVDEELRRSRKEQLEERYEELESRIISLARPILEERRDRIEKPHLIWQTTTCECCRNGSGKRDACWSCAGFDRSPTKGMLVEHLTEHGYTRHEDSEPYEDRLKADLEDLVLSPCKVCDGEGQWESFELNIRSVDQLRDLLYNALRLPKRFTNKRLSVDEDSLTSILSTL